MPDPKKRYRKPPILEAIVEVLYDEDTPDPSVAGRFYEGWKERCIRRDQFQTQHVLIQFGPSTGAVPSTPPLPTERLWLSARPGLAVQVGPGVLSIHFVRNPPLPEAGDGQPYPGFEWFVPHVLAAVEHYQQLGSARGLKQTSMRYINRIEVPIGEDGIAEDWLTIGLSLPPSFSSIQEYAADIGMDLDSVGADLRYSVKAGPAVEKILGVWLDLRVTSKPDRRPTFETLAAWLRTAHDEGIIKPFEGSVTDNARNTFEVIDAATER